MTPDGGRQNPLRRPKTLGGVVYLGVGAVCLLGLLLSLLSWRRGVTTIGAGLLVGAMFRAALGEYDAGMLRVRRRWFDVLAMTVVGFLLIFLAATIPDQPTT